MPLALSISCDVLCVCNPFDQQAVFSWLTEDKERFLIILGEESHLEHERIRFCPEDNEQAMKKLAWEFVFLEFGYLEKTQSIEKLLYYAQGVHLVASDFKNRGLDHLENFIKNSRQFFTAKQGRRLFGAFKDIPAIICGAGPSLEKNLSFLQSMKDRALIFAGGTALSALSLLGIKPDFSGFIDPHPPEDRMFLHAFYETPTFFQSRTHWMFFDSIQGDLLWMAGNEHDLFEKEIFDGGWNVATFLTAIATHLGCNPISFVGVDLMQTKDKTYVKDLHRSEGGKLIALEDGLYTRRDWLFARDWLDEFEKKHPEVEWNREKNAKQKDLSGKIHAEIQSIPQGVALDFEPIELMESFKKVEMQCEQMVQLLEKTFPNPVEKNPEITLLQLEIEREIAYTLFLLPIWNVWKYVFARKITKDVPIDYGLNLNQWLFMKGICDDARKI